MRSRQKVKESMQQIDKELEKVENCGCLQIWYIILIYQQFI